MSLTVRASVAGFVAAGVLQLAGAASAGAELRTAHYQNTDPVSTGSATNPQVRSVLLNYDSSGTLTAQLTFFPRARRPEPDLGSARCVGDRTVGRRLRRGRLPRL